MLDMVAERRIGNLESLMARVWRTLDQVGRQIEQTDRQIERTGRQIERTQRNLDQLSYEMGEFKNEMSDFKDETRASRVDMNKKWGELSNRLGTMAEDLIAPSVPSVLRQMVACPDDPVESVAVRVKRLHPADRGRSQEFDVVAACGEYVLINETKSRLDPQVVQRFAQRMPQARDFFPEYAGKKFIGAIASLYVDESLMRYGERHGLIVLGFGTDVMQVLNSPGFVPKTF